MITQNMNTVCDLCQLYQQNTLTLKSYSLFWITKNDAKEDKFDNSLQGEREVINTTCDWRPLLWWLAILLDSDKNTFALTWFMTFNFTGSENKSVYCQTLPFSWSVHAVTCTNWIQVFRAGLLHSYIQRDFKLRNMVYKFNIFEGL